MPDDDSLDRLEQSMQEGFRTLTTAINVKDDRITDVIHKLETRMGEFMHQLASTKTEMTRLAAKLEPSGAPGLEARLLMIDEHIARSAIERGRLREEMLERIQNGEDRAERIEAKHAAMEAKHAAIEWKIIWGLGGIVVTGISVFLSHMWNMVTHTAPGK